MRRYGYNRVCLLLIALLYFTISDIKAQVPTKCLEILSILVDGCDGNNEGQNEMAIFQIGPTPLNVINLQVNGAGANGLITQNVWPTTANPWLGIAVPPAMPAAVAQINATITHCGKLIEPVGGILPAGKKILLITSTAFNPLAHSFANLSDTLYVIFQNSGNTGGHFGNYGTSSLRTLVLEHTTTGCADTVVYDRSLLLNQAGIPGAQDGGAVSYSYGGIPTYFNNGCTVPFTPFNVSVSQDTSVCAGSPVPLTATVVGGGGTFTYIWSNGMTGSTITVSPIATTIYTVTATNTCGSTASGSATVTINGSSSLIATFTSSRDSMCLGETTNITFTGNNGGAGCTYNWNFDGAITNPALTTSAGPFSATWSNSGIKNISLIITNGGCSANSTLAVDVNPLPVATTSQTQVPCFGLCDGSAMVIPDSSEGHFPFAFTWDDIANQTSINAVNLCVGTYHVTVTNTSGCTTVSSAQITQPNQLTASIIGTDIQCNGGNNGQATLTVTGGILPYSYLWSNASTNQNQAGLSLGTYTVTVTDSSMCTANASVTIAQNLAMISSIIPTAALCSGSPSGSADLTISGGTSPFTFLWSNGSTNEDLISVIAGMYHVTATDVNLCSIIDSVAIGESTVISVDATTIDVLCNGGHTGFATPTVDGGIAPYTYTWSNSTINQNLINVGAGTYTVTVKDVNLCTANVSVTITEPSAISATVVATNNQCAGDNTGAAALTETGGTPTYTYLWSNGQTLSNLTAVQAGTYSVTITDANNCTSTASVTIVAPVTIIANITNPTNVSCNGGSNGTATVTVNGGTTPYAYSWNTIPTQTLATASGLTVGEYIITVTDSHQCITTATVTITEPIILSATGTSTNTSCYHVSNGTANISVTGGTIPYSYSWSNGSVTQGITDASAGTYTVSISDAHSCLTTVNVTIVDPIQLVVSTVSVTNLSCYGGSDGQTSVIAEGGTPPLTYSWSTNPSWNQTSMTNLHSGDVVVTVIDSKSCIVAHTITLTAPQQINNAPAPDVTICKGGSATLSMVTMGGVLPYTYHWDTGENTSSIHISPEINTNYSCYVTDGNNCVGATQSITVSVLPPVQLDAITYDNSICPGDSVEIHLNASNGIPPYLLSLSDGTIISTPYYASPTHTEIIHFIVKDKCHSEDTASLVANVYSVPLIHITADKYTGCSPLMVNFHETSLNEGQTYIWSFDNEDENNLSFSKNPSHMFDIAGSYDVILTVTSVNGCKITNTLKDFILVHPLPDARFVYNPTIPKIITPEVEFTNLSGGNVENYWSFGDGDSSLEINPEHVYKTIGEYEVVLIVWSDKGCSDTTKQLVKEQDYNTLYAPTAFSPDGDGKNDIFYLYGSGIMEGTFKLMIYDRWGEKIFESNDIQKGWNGTMGGKKVKTGSYVWLAVFKDFFGNGKTVTGKVTVIR